jgi:putative membrane protein
MAEVMMGQLAIQRGQTQAERDFGQMLVTDHTQADDQLTAIAQTSMLRTAPGPTHMQQAMYQQLESAPGDQFDSMFNQVMIPAHRQTIALFRMETQSGQNPQLRQFAATTLPVLYKHLHVAESLSPMQSPVMASSGMASSGMASMSRMPMSQTPAALDAPVHGNPDRSADQLNARELSSGNPS